jgi:hypothetical protein
LFPRNIRIPVKQGNCGVPLLRENYSLQWYHFTLWYVIICNMAITWNTMLIQWNVKKKN